MAINGGRQDYRISDKHNIKQHEEYAVSDNELATLSAGNDMSSFDELYRRHYRRVYSICLKMTHNMAESEDLAHDVFIQLQRNIGSFRGESSFVSWLHRITVNQVLMKFRKKSHRCELTTDEGVMPEAVLPNSEKPDNMPIIDNIALTTAIAKLPNGYRKIFLLHDVEGYEHEEIGKLLGISAGTSKSQLHKARMRLRTLIQETAGEVKPEQSESTLSKVMKLFTAKPVREKALLAA